MSRALSLCLWFMVAATAACSSPTIGYDFDSRVDFQTYRTYEWLTDAQEVTGDRRLDNSLVDTRIRSAIGTELRSKGYRVSGGTKPDFFVAYHVKLNDMMKGTSTQNYIGDRAHGTYTTISDIESYREGTLLLDIVDAASMQLVWRGSALSEVDMGMTPEERNARITRAVRGMLTHFPPK
ncbi:MAG TPA: DUF4136 domain-containing protein [Nitrospira sp.]|nr:DUF4136 domain-containing protein [Nitrospira sp.]